MSKELFMGIDIGTTGVRAVLFNEKGYEVSLSYKEYPMRSSPDGKAEIEPEVVFKSMLDVVKNCIEQVENARNKISAIGLSTQLFSLVAVDRHGNCLTNVITWADTRSIKEGGFIEKNFDCMALYRKTGCRVQHPMYPLSKILWIKNNHKDIYEKTYKFISIKEYIIFKLYGVFVLDLTDASATACFNIHKFVWDEDVLEEVLGVDKEKFGTPVECIHVLKGMKEEYAKIMGIPKDTPLVIGSGDGILANLGCGVFDNTELSSTIGTSGAIRTAVDFPLLDKEARTWCYCFTKDKWVAGGAINNGGIVLRWLRDMHVGEYSKEAREKGFNNVYELFDSYAKEIRPGSDGLLFFPYLTGQRSPHWRADARGVIYGLNLSHNKKHLVRAAMEGIIFNMFMIYNALMEQLRNPVRKITANGGYAKSGVWLQIQADVFDKEILVAGVEEAAALGAAFLSMVGIGAKRLIKEDALPAMRAKRPIEPIKENVEIYKNVYRNFIELYNLIFKNSGEVKNERDNN